MQPRIETLPEKKLIGKRLRMTLNNDRTFDLWRSFMPHRKEIKNSVSNDLICLLRYDDPLNLKDFTKDTEFEKWAAVEVSGFENIPNGMEPYTLKGRLYAVFIHKGLPEGFEDTSNEIFRNWLPGSGYELDNREHFFVMGDKYKHSDPSSEEEYCVPITAKSASISC